MKSNGEYLSNRTKQSSYHNSTRNILLKWFVIVIINIYLHRGVRWYAYWLWSFKAFCLRGWAICKVGLLIGLCASFKTNKGIQSIFCDCRPATTSSFGIHSRLSHFMQRLISWLLKKYSLVHKPRNSHKIMKLNSLENKSQSFSEHVITKLSTVRWEFRLLYSMQSF